jgi:glutathione S-transferase
MKLYTFDSEPNPRRVNLFLAWKGIEIPKQQVDLRGGEQFGAAFRTANPRCTVPVLELDDGTVLCDAIAICWYLERLFPQRPLFGSEPLTQARVFSWDAYLTSEAFLPAADALRNRHEAFKDRAVPGPEPVAQIPELEARGRQRVQRFHRHLDDHLEGREYVAGDQLTLADFDTLVVIDFTARIKEPVPVELARVHAWYRRITALLPPG